MRVIGLARHSAVHAMAVCRPPSMLTGTLELCGRGGYSPMRGAILQCLGRVTQIVSFPKVGDTVHREPSWLPFAFVRQKRARADEKLQRHEVDFRSSFRQLGPNLE